MSTVITKEEAANLVTRAVATTLDYGLRRAGALLTVSHTHVSMWRKWVKAGSDPETLPELEPETVLGLRRHLAVSHEIETRRAALYLAAERMEEMARELRAEAGAPETTARRGARAGQAAHRATRPVPRPESEGTAKDGS